MDHKGKHVTRTVLDLVYGNMLLVEAMAELLTEKGILSKEELHERVEQLKAVSPINDGPIQ